MFFKYLNKSVVFFTSVYSKTNKFLALTYANKQETFKFGLEIVYVNFKNYFLKLNKEN